MPSISFQEFADEEAFVVEGVQFTPIPVDHVVPTHGFLIEHEGAAVLWSSDTGPTDRFWEIANRTPNLQALFIDVSFDNEMQKVAEDSGHLTPRLLEEELAKLDSSVQVFLHHMKPFCIDAIEREVAALERPGLGFIEQGKTYSF